MRFTFGRSGDFDPGQDRSLRNYLVRFAPSFT
jgi:hypothetical protein